MQCSPFPQNYKNLTMKIALKMKIFQNYSELKPWFKSWIKKHNIIPSWENTHNSNLVWFWDIIYNFKYTTLIILGILLNFRNKIHDFNHSWDLVKFLIHNINPWLVWDIFTILNPRHYSWLVFTSEIRWISTHDTNHVWARKSKNTTLVLSIKGKNQQ